MPLSRQAYFRPCPVKNRESNGLASDMQWSVATHHLRCESRQHRPAFHLQKRPVE